LQRSLLLLRQWDGRSLANKPAGVAPAQGAAGPYPSDEMICRPVSARIGNVKNNATPVWLSPSLRLWINRTSAVVVPSLTARRSQRVAPRAEPRRGRSKETLQSTYKFSPTEYTETLLFSASDDGSGKPPAYSQTPQTKNTPVTRESGRMAFKLPFDSPSVVIEGDKMTATAESTFIDYWERVR
jgi:hypothetical protein